MSTRRFLHTATLLPNGKVLVTGGQSTTSSSALLATAELDDPATGTWNSAGSMTTTRHAPRATFLPEGRVLVLGGYGSHGPVAAEVYDPGA